MGFEVISVWEPYEVLGLDPDVKNTCVGRAPSKGNAPCRRQVCLADRKLACNALNAMALRSPSKITPKSLEKLACLLLCKNYHQYQISEMVEDWTERINDFQDRDQDTKKWVSGINQLRDELEKVKRQANDDRQESKAAKQLLSELAQRGQEAEKLRKQLSEARRAEEEALQAKAKAEQVAQDLAAQLDGLKRSTRKVINRLRSRERDLTGVKKSEEKLTEELVLVRDQLGEMLYNPPPGEPWWAINCELSFESTYGVVVEVRKAFGGIQSTVEDAQQQMSIEETDNSTLQQTLASAQAETDTAKKQPSAREIAYTTLQPHLASAHAKLNTRDQQLALGEETISETQQELTSTQEVGRSTKQQSTHQIRIDPQSQPEASRMIAGLGEIVRALHRRRGEAEKRIAADDELFGALRLGGIRFGVFAAVVGALQMLDRR